LQKDQEFKTNISTEFFLELVREFQSEEPYFLGYLQTQIKFKSKIIPAIIVEITAKLDDYFGADKVTSQIVTAIVNGLTALTECLYCDERLSK
jgi:hypothetical protein